MKRRLVLDESSLNLVDKLSSGEYRVDRFNLIKREDGSIFLNINDKLVFSRTIDTEETESETKTVIEETIFTEDSKLIQVDDGNESVYNSSVIYDDGCSVSVELSNPDSEIPYYAYYITLQDEDGERKITYKFQHGHFIYEYGNDICVGFDTHSELLYLKYHQYYPLFIDDSLPKEIKRIITKYNKAADAMEDLLREYVCQEAKENNLPIFDKEVQSNIEALIKDITNGIDCNQERDKESIEKRVTVLTFAACNIEDAAMLLSVALLDIQNGFTNDIYLINEIVYNIAKKYSQGANGIGKNKKK